MKVEYKLVGELKETLYVVYELRSISGMEPEAVTLDDGTKVRFTYGDYRLLLSGDIAEEEYVKRNLITE